MAKLSYAQLKGTDTKVMLWPIFPGSGGWIRTTNALSSGGLTVRWDAVTQHRNDAGWSACVSIKVSVEFSRCCLTLLPAPVTIRVLLVQSQVCCRLHQQGHAST